MVRPASNACRATCRRLQFDTDRTIRKVPNLARSPGPGCGPAPVACAATERRRQPEPDG